MKRDEYDKQLIRWAKNHYWDSLEKNKDLILRHLRTFAGESNAAQHVIEADAEKQAVKIHEACQDGASISDIMQILIRTEG